MSRMRAVGCSHRTFPHAHFERIGWSVGRLGGVSNRGYCVFGVAYAGARSIGLDRTIADGDDAVGVVGDVGLVGNEDDGVALGVELVEEGHDFDGGFGVEVAGGLIGE